MVQRFEQLVVKDRASRVQQDPSSLLRAPLRRRSCLVDQLRCAKVGLFGVYPVQERHHAACGGRLSGNPCSPLSPAHRPLTLTRFALPVVSLLLSRFRFKNGLSEIGEVRHPLDYAVRTSPTVATPKRQRDPLELHPSCGGMGRVWTPDRTHVDREP
jgi:hypothetical protein